MDNLICLCSSNCRIALLIVSNHEVNSSEIGTCRLKTCVSESMIHFDEQKCMYAFFFLTFKTLDSISMDGLALTKKRKQTNFKMVAVSKV